MKSINGVDWVYKNEGIEYRKKHLQKVCFDPKNMDDVFIGGYAIFFSENGGNTWNDVSLTGILENKNLGRFKSASFSIYTGYYQTLWRKEETSSKWLIKYVDHNFGVGDVDIAKDNLSTIFLTFSGEDGNFIKSIDKGITWGNFYSFPPGIRFIENYNQDIIYIGGYDAMSVNPPPAIYRSTNGGQTWAGGYILREGTGLNDLSVATSEIAYAGSKKGKWESYFFRTFDGNNWEWLSELTYLGDIYSLEAYGEINPAIVFAGTPNIIWRSNDYGNSWEEVFSIPDYGINDIISDPEDHAILYTIASKIIEPEKFPQILGNSRIFYSLDLGRKWFEIQPPLQVPIKQIEVDLDYPDTLLINTQDKGIYFTNTNWERDQLTSSSDSALWGNSNIKLRKKQDTIFAVYESGKGIFYTYTNNYKDFKPKYEIDDGILPSLDLNPDDPYVVYIKNNKIYGTARIIEQNGKRRWATPWILYSPPLNYNIHYPSFLINPNNFQGYVLFKETQENNISLKVIYFDARIPNPPVNIFPPINGEIYDYCLSRYNYQGIEVPSIVYTRNTPNGVRVFFRYWDYISNSWSPEEAISPISTSKPYHPFLTLSPSNVPACAWSQDGIIYYSERRNGRWTRPIGLSSGVYVSDYPQIYPEPLIVCWRQMALVNSGIYQIAFRWKTAIGWSNVIVIDGGNENRDYPQIVCGKISGIDYLFSIFQKEIEPIYDLSFRKIPLIPVDEGFYYLGEPYLNSYTIYREGYEILGYEPEKMVDFGDSIFYSIELPPGNYTIILFTYSSFSKKQRVYINSSSPYIWDIIPNQISTFIKEVSVYDSVLSIKIKKKNFGKASCGLIKISSSERKGGSQGLNSNIISGFNIYPKIIDEKFKIDYFGKENFPLEILLYDLAGRKIKTFYKGFPKNGVYSITIKRPYEIKKGVYFIKINDKVEKVIFR